MGRRPGRRKVGPFAVDRLSGLQVGSRPGAFTRPKGFRAAAAVPTVPWEAGEAGIEVAVRFDPEVAWWARRQLTADAVVEEEAGGGLLARFSVAALEPFIGWMVGFEDQAEVLSPPEVRRALLAHLGEP